MRPYAMIGDKVSNSGKEGVNFLSPELGIGRAAA